jgi:hypothetical protein
VVIAPNYSLAVGTNYACYHCQEGCTRESNETLEQQFEGFVLQLQPNAGYMRLYREIVTHVWRKPQVESQKVQDVVSP